MHNLYLVKYETEIYNQLKNGEEVHPKVKYEFFTDHFGNNFNISFGFPRTDTCQTCDHLKMVIDAQIDVDQKLVLQSEKDLHVAKAELFYKDLKKYIQEAKILDNKIEVLCFIINRIYHYLMYQQVMYSTSVNYGYTTFVYIQVGLESLTFICMMKLLQKRVKMKSSVF